MFLAWKSKSFKDRKLEHLTLQNQEAKGVIAFLLDKLEESGVGMETWPIDTNHNIIRLSLTDLKLLEEPLTSVVQFACSECGCEIPQYEAEKSKKAKCGSCYMEFKRAQRAKTER